MTSFIAILTFVVGSRLTLLPIDSVVTVSCNFGGMVANVRIVPILSNLVSTNILLASRKSDCPVAYIDPSFSRLQSDNCGYLWL